MSYDRRETASGCGFLDQLICHVYNWNRVYTFLVRPFFLYYHCMIILSSSYLPVTYKYRTPRSRLISTYYQKPIDPPQYPHLPVIYEEVHCHVISFSDSLESFEFNILFRSFRHCPEPSLHFTRQPPILPPRTYHGATINTPDPTNLNKYRPAIIYSIVQP